MGLTFIETEGEDTKYPKRLEVQVGPILSEIFKKEVYLFAEPFKKNSFLEYFVVTVRSFSRVRSRSTETLNL
ncbi:hypothetical protein DDZ15_12115 [Rhodohalobacter mucosus]|uniref:Uncharacterized protein n=1 Tax=Rhodohalobacter mucosus TaxID=2079485 RepID=A0A316TUC6_9BACT|nr:hypothetical protein DDZ15_12115 [Rhodohalobacter mucosus]